MIKQIEFQFGATATDAGLIFNASSVTVFVGPNNGGKSLALREIEQFCRKFEGHPANRIIQHISFGPIDPGELTAAIDRLRVEPRPNERASGDHMWISKFDHQTKQQKRTPINRNQLLKEVTGANVPHGEFAKWVNLHTLKLDGVSRLELVKSQSAGNLQTESTNLLLTLFQDDALRSQVRQIVYEAFGKYLVVDPTNMGSLNLRLSDREPDDSSEERGWDDRSVDFHKAARLIEQASDGVKAFIGMIVSFTAGAPRIVLIDEPEAFLHPSLSMRLGKEVSRRIDSVGGRLILATHSPHMLMGCIHSGAQVNIVRLTYNYDAPTARLLPREVLVKLMQNPMLRSTGVLEGLFYESVVVAEGDSDRAFYQEINERLLSANDGRGIPNCLFINAQNKQTIWDILRPLRELGIPTAAVVDLDVIKDGGGQWTKVLRAAGIPEMSQEGLHSPRQKLKDALDKTGKQWKTEGGIDSLPDPERNAANFLFDPIELRGVFCVRKGEVESWLSHLGVSTNKSTWLREVFEQMGDDPASSDYMKPAPGDIWDFIGSIKKWLTDPARLGIPSPVPPEA